MQVSEKYTIDKEYECKAIFTTTDLEHPGVEKVMAQ
jgi:sulfate adenylyltransferase